MRYLREVRHLMGVAACRAIGGEFKWQAIGKWRSVSGLRVTRCSGARRSSLWRKPKPRSYLRPQHIRQRVVVESRQFWSTALICRPALGVLRRPLLRHLHFLGQLSQGIALRLAKLLFRQILRRREIRTADIGVC